MDYENVGRKIISLVKEAEVKGISESRMRKEIEKIIENAMKEGE